MVNTDGNSGGRAVAQSEQSGDSANSANLTVHASGGAGAADCGWEEAEAEVQSRAQTENSARWGPPHRVLSEVPPFPTSLLPPWVRNWVEATAHATQTPPDVAALAALAVVSAVVGNKVKVAPRPGRTMPICVFTLAVLDSASGKSSVHSAATAPLRRLEDEQRTIEAASSAGMSSRRLIADRVLRRKVAAAAKAGGADAALNDDVEKAAANLAQLTEKPARQLVVGDCTPEQLAIILDEQQGHCAIFSAEGGTLRHMAAERPGGDVYPQAFSGETIRVDRRSGTRVRVPAPGLTICMAVQPEVFAAVARRARLRERGTLGRFLYALPKSLLGDRDPFASAVPEEVAAAYETGVKRLASEVSGLGERPEGGGVQELVLDTDAAVRLAEFQVENERRLKPDGDLRAIADWAGRLPEHVARIAALLHLAEKGLNGSVPLEAIEAALQMAPYLTAHAKAVLDPVSADASRSDAAYVLTGLKRCRLRRFSERDLFEHTKRSLDTMDRLRAALAHLVAGSYVRETPMPPRQGPGRPPSPCYEVNPAVHSQNSQNGV